MKTSISTKLLLVLVLTAVSINLATFFTFRLLFSPPHRQESVDGRPHEPHPPGAHRGPPRGPVHPALLVTLLSVVGFIVAGAYFSMSQILRPLRALDEGVSKIASGDFTHRVALEQSDEFGRLALSFNGMTGRVRDMMTAKQQLLLDVSHELRSPLTRMKLALEFYPSERTRAQFVKEISEMDQMLEEILEGARLGSDYGALQRRPVDVKSVVEEVLRKYPGVRLEPSGPCPTQADPVRLGTAIRNLVDNAVKHSPQDTAVDVALRQTGGDIEIIVRDGGPGIPVAERESIFEPFYRVDKSRSRDTGGFGLGLHLARKIARAHGGDVTISCPARGGTVVSLRFPTVS